MRLKVAAIRTLLRIYPRCWREEYGQELEALLLEDIFSTSVFLDSLFSAVNERARAADPRLLCGALALIWSLFWVTWNSVNPLSQTAYLILCRLEAVPGFFAAYWAARCRAGSFIQALKTALTTGAVIVAPDQFLLALYAAGLRPLVLVDNVTGHVSGHGIALLHVRGIPGVIGRSAGFEGIVVLLLLSVLAFGVSGILGASLSAIVTNLQANKARLR